MDAPGMILGGLAANKLMNLTDSGDTEGAHSEADDILCELLIGLGFKDTVVAAFKRVPKWYA